MSSENQLHPNNPDTTNQIKTEHRNQEKYRFGLVKRILVIVLPPVGLVISIIALHKIKANHLSGKGTAIFGIIRGAIFTLPFLFFTWAFIELGGLKTNAAKRDVQPLVRQIEGAGGKKICDGGYNGYGIDEDNPEYSIYFTVPNSPRLTSNIKVAASQLGYPLMSNDSTIPYGIKSSPESDYFDSDKGNGSNLNVAIYRDMSVPLYCGNSFDGSRKITASNDAVVYIHFSLPPVNQD